jgi:hypothetical protein
MEDAAAEPRRGGRSRKATQRFEPQQAKGEFSREGREENQGAKLMWAGVAGKKRRLDDEDAESDVS